MEGDHIPLSLCTLMFTCWRQFLTTGTLGRADRLPQGWLPHCVVARDPSCLVLTMPCPPCLPGTLASPFVSTSRGDDPWAALERHSVAR